MKKHIAEPATFEDVVKAYKLTKKDVKFIVALAKKTLKKV